MRLNMYKTKSDLIRMGLEIIYVLAFSYNMYLFWMQLKERNTYYKRWQTLEVDTLSEVEKK